MDNSGAQETVRTPPRGLLILALVGPSFIWCGEYIATGEVILATRVGSILGPAVLWAVVLGIFLKYWIGLSGARYTVCTGEGMIDMFRRIPGPRNWVVWIVLAVQFIAATVSIGALATSAGIFVSSLIPIGSTLAGWLVALFALCVVWSGMFRVLQMVMSVLVLIILVGVLYVAAHVLPSLREVLEGLSFQVPAVPGWASSQEGIGDNPWHELLPLIGWGAGGFASQVWYTYWVLGARYGAAARGEPGKPADETFLKEMNRDTARKIKGWCRVVYADATLALLIGTTVTCAFLIAGAGILGPARKAPQGEAVAMTLSEIFSSNWGALGGFLFRLAGAAAIISGLIGQLAGWPRLLADSFRICLPPFRRALSWKRQFRLFLLFFLATNMVIVFSMGMRPVYLIKISAILDGLLLTSLQALWVGIGLFVVLPRLLSREAHDVLRPSWIFAVGLALAFLAFSYICVFLIPFSLPG